MNIRDISLGMFNTLLQPLSLQEKHINIMSVVSFNHPSLTCTSTPTSDKSSTSLHEQTFQIHFIHNSLSHSTLKEKVLQQINIAWTIPS